MDINIKAKIEPGFEPLERYFYIYSLRLLYQDRFLHFLPLNISLNKSN